MKIATKILFILLLFTINSVAQIQNNGNLKIHNAASIGIFGNFTNNGTFDNNLGTLHILGNNPQTLDGSNPIHVSNLTIDKSSNFLQLNNELQIAGLLTFTNGKIVSDTANIATEFVHFLDGASYINASNTSHIDGVIRKTGNDAFVFPTGNNGFLRTIGISAPSVVNDHFTAYYTENNPTLVYNDPLAVGLDHISSCEYWILDRTGGSSTVEVTLSWASNSCGVDTLCDLRVARWDGSQWTSEGNGGITGSEIAGTLVSGSNCTTPAGVANFSPFTLASVSNNNELPIELVFFEAQRCDNDVCLSWQTETELNNDYFTVERSNDAIRFEEVTRVKGAGNSLIVLNYNALDDNPFYGVSYYRLRQTDFDGQESFSAIRAVEFNGLNSQEVLVFPNPTSDQVTLKGAPSELEECRIFTLLGQEVTANVNVLNSSGSRLQLDFSILPTGVYTIKTKTSSHKVIKQ